MFDQIFLSLVIMVIGYAALFGLKRFAAGTVLCLPLLATLLLYHRSVKATFYDLMRTMPLHTAADLDRADQVCMQTLTRCAFCRKPGGACIAPLISQGRESVRKNLWARPLLGKCKLFCR